MFQVAKIAYRNLLRYTRRTLLTSTLVTIGMVSVLVFVAVSGSFKGLMVGQITDSMLGHMQVHRKGYVASIDNSPLNLNLNKKQMEKVREILDSKKIIENYSPRIKFSGGLSNFTSTTNIRLNGIEPEKELKTVPLLSQRVTTKEGEKVTLNRGEVWIPEVIANGMKLEIGAQVVIIATNKDGSVNAFPFIVKGIVGTMTGPGGRDGYINIADVYDLLRIEKGEANEIAIRLADFDKMEPAFKSVQSELMQIKNKKDKPVFEIHTWKKLSPFSTIANIIDMLTIFVKVILIAIVLVSIMNVMLMAVYERIREIGTIAAIGTTPGKIWSLFLMEGLFLGTFGAAVGSIISVAIIKFFQFSPINMAFGRQDALQIAPTIAASEVVITAIIVIVISGLASLQPAVKASKLEPVDALRHI
jgi:putative ABC transport system permease protein